MTAAAGAPAARLFFALWPGAAATAALHTQARAIAADAGGRAMRRETLHLTLAFLGAVPPERAECLPAIAARAVRTPAFTFSLDRLGWWRHNRIVWAGAAAPPATLGKLAADLAGELASAGFAVEKRPFVPHVTLVRNAAAVGALPTLPDIRWPVDELVLVRSNLSAGGAAYERIGAWALARPAA